MAKIRNDPPEEGPFYDNPSRYRADSGLSPYVLQNYTKYATFYRGLEYYQSGEYT